MPYKKQFSLHCGNLDTVLLRLIFKHQQNITLRNIHIDFINLTKIFFYFFAKKTEVNMDQLAELSNSVYDSGLLGKEVCIQYY
jgi:hypothetical protein